MLTKEQLINRKIALLQKYTPEFKAQVGDAFNLQSLARMLVQYETTQDDMGPMMTEATEYAQYIPTKVGFPAVVGTSHDLIRKSGVGEGQSYSGTGGEVPLAEVKYDEISLKTRAGVMGYQYSIMELATAGAAGITLEADKIEAARLGFEKHMSRIAWIGEPNEGLYGLFNQDGVSLNTATTAWESATADAILADINDVLADAIDASEYNPAITPDMVLLPTSLMRVLTTRRLADNLETTLFEWISKNNLLALQNKPVTFRGTSRCETQGVGGTRRITVYRRDPSCIEMRIPQDLEFLAPQPQNLDLFTPGHYLYQGVWLKRVDSLRYLDVPQKP